MDDRRFDELARTLVAGPASRRWMLRLLGGGALGGFITTLRTENAAAACGKVGDRCKRRRDCCSGAICEQKKCACPDTATDCNGRCISDFTNNRRHCGGCNQRCAEGVSCKEGRCLAPTCPKGTGANPCGGELSTTFCSATDYCFCVRRAEGGRRCSANFNCVNDPTCTTDPDCAAGQFCAVIEGCCDGGTVRRCVNPCANPA